MPTKVRQPCQPDDWSYLLGKKIKVAFDDSTKVSVVNGELKRWSPSFLFLNDAGRVQAVPTKRIVRIEVMDRVFFDV